MLYADKTPVKSRWNALWTILFCAVLTVAVRQGGAQTLTEPPRLHMETGGHIGAVHGLLFTPLDPANPQNGRLISCGADKVVRVHALAQDDAAAWRYQIGEGFGGQFFAAALNPAQPNQLALGSSGKDTKADSDILLTDVVTGSQTARLTQHKGTITGLAYAPDGSLLASCGTDGKVILWTLSDAAKNNSVKTAGKPSAHVLSKPVPRTLLDEGDYMTGVAFAENGRWLAATGWRVDDEDAHRGIIRIWQLDAQPSLQQIRAQQIHTKQIHTFAWGSGISCVAWAPPSKRYPQGLLTYGSEDGVIELRDPAQNFGVSSLLTIQNDSVTCLACSRDGTRLLSGSGSKGHDVAARIWSLENDAQIKAFERHSTTVLSVAFAPDGKTAASGDAFGMVYLWSAQNGDAKNGNAKNGDRQNEPEMSASEEIRSFKGPGNPVFKVAWSSDGSRVAWGSAFGRETLEHAFDMGNGIPDPKFSEPQYTWRRGQHTWTKAASHAQGKSGAGPSFVLTAMPDDSGVVIRNNRGQETRRIKLGVTDRLRCYSFTPDGRVVVGSDLDLAVYTLTGKYARRKVSFEGHEGPVLDVTVDPTGRYLASGGLDQTVRLWDLKAAERALAAVPEDVGDTRSDSPGLLPHQDAAQTWRPSPIASPIAGAFPLNSIPAIHSLLGIFEGDGGVWAAWAQNGCYAASPAGEDVIGWHINQGADKPAEFRTAYQCPQFYQPDVIAQVAKTGDLNRALAAVFPDRMPSFLDMPTRIARVPKLASVRVEANGRDLQPGADGAYHSDTPHVTLHCRYETCGPNLTVEAALNNTNGKPFTLLDIKGVELEPYDRQSAERNPGVPALQSGQNTIRLFAQNSSGISDDSVRVVYDDSALPLPTLRVLAVGISRYNNPGLRLKYAAKDAQDIQDFFQASSQANVQTDGRKLFQEVESVSLLDQAATRQNIQTKLEELLHNVKSQDTVLLYFSCHGFAADGEAGKTYYLAPADIAITKSDEGRNTVQNGYAWKDILNRLTKVQAQHIVLIIDHCFAGGVSSTLENERFQMQTQTLRKMRQNNLLVFTASASTEYSYEDDSLQHGVFTAAILDALKGGMDRILYPDGRAMLNALDFWVPLQVARMGNGKFKAQHPFLFALPDANKAVPLANVSLGKPAANP